MLMGAKGLPHSATSGTAHDTRRQRLSISSMRVSSEDVRVAPPTLRGVTPTRTPLTPRPSTVDSGHRPSGSSLGLASRPRAQLPIPPPLIATAAVGVPSLRLTPAAPSASTPLATPRAHAVSAKLAVPPGSTSTTPRPAVGSRRHTWTTLTAAAATPAVATAPTHGAVYHAPPHRAQPSPAPPTMATLTVPVHLLSPRRRSREMGWDTLASRGQTPRTSGLQGSWMASLARGGATATAGTSAAVTPRAGPTSALSTAAPPTTTGRAASAARATGRSLAEERPARTPRSYAPLVSRGGPVVVVAAAAYPSAAARERSEHVYFNVAPQRCFLGQFRSAAAVVVHASPAITAHVPPVDVPDACIASDEDDDHMDKGNGNGKTEEPEVGVGVAGVDGSGTDEGGDPPSPAAAASGTRTAVEPVVDEDHMGSGGVATAASAAVEKPNGRGGSGVPPSAVGRRATHGGNARLSLGGGHPLSLSGYARAPSVSSSSYTGGRRARSVGGASSTATRWTRHTLALPGASRGARSGDTGRRGLVSASATAIRHDQARLNQQLHMPALHATGLHETLWVAAQDGSVELRSMAAPRDILAVLPADPAARTVVTSMAQVSARGVVLGLSDGTLRLVDAGTAQVVHEERAAHAGAAITCLHVFSRCLSGDEVGEVVMSNTLAVGSLDGTISLWEAATLRRLGTLEVGRRGVNPSITALAALGGGMYLFSGDEDGALRMWHLPSFRPIALTREELRCLQDAATATRIARASRQGAQLRLGISRVGDGEEPASHSPLLDEGEGDCVESPRGASPLTRARGELLVAGDGAADSAPSPLSHPTPRSRHRDSGAAPGGDGSVQRTKISGVRGSTPRRRTVGPPAKSLAAAVQRATTYMEQMMEDMDYTARVRMWDSGDVSAGGGGGCYVDRGAFTDGAAFAWPIEAAHREAVTGLAVVEDCWLVSVSRDMTAKVFGLPNGVHVRTLGAQQPRRVPLTGVLYDCVQGRVWVGGADGSLVAFDMRTPEMDMVAHLRPPSASFSSIYAPIQARSMYRFYLCCRCATEGEGEEALVASLAVLDRDTLAHGPGGSSTTYRVGEPSLRELSGAMQLSTLQAKAALQRCGQERLTETRAPEVYALAAQRAHTRRLVGRYYAAWQRLRARRRLRAEHRLHAGQLASTVEEALASRYYATWSRFCTLIRAQTYTDAVHVLTRRAQPSVTGVVTLEGHGMAAPSLAAATAPAPSPRLVHLHRRVSLDPVVRQQRRRALAVVADALARGMSLAGRRRCFAAWLSFTRARQRERRVGVAYGRLMLAYHSPLGDAADPTWALATRRAVRATRLERAGRLMAWREELLTAPCLRRRYYTTWSRALAEARRARQARVNGGDAWQLVAPLSATLIRPHSLRARCFHLWRDFAMCVVKSGRLREEEHTMRREYLSLQNSIDNPSTMAQLQAEERELETAIARAAFARDAVCAAERTTRQEVVSLHMRSALRVLLAGFQSPATVGTRAAGGGGAGEREGDIPAAGARNGASASRRTSTSSTARLAWGVSGPSPAPPTTSPSSQLLTEPPLPAPSRARTLSLPSTVLEDDDDFTAPSSAALAEQLRAVLHAVKGAALDYGRDASQVAAAHAFALELPIGEPSAMAGGPRWNGQGTSPHGAPGSGGGGAAGRAGVSYHRRQLSHSGTIAAAGGAGSTNWSVTVTSTGSHGGAPRRTSVAAAAAAAAAASSGYTTEAAGPPRTYACLADAMDGTVRELHELLCTAAREAGVDVAGPDGWLHLPAGEGLMGGAVVVPSVAEHGPSSTHPAGAHVDAVQRSLRWLRAVPARTRREVMGLALRLVALYDSFSAHSEAGVEGVGGGLSTRGATVVRPLPLRCLCAPATAALLVRHAAVLLELVQPRLWQRQCAVQRAVELGRGAEVVLVPTGDLSSLPASLSTPRGRAPATEAEGEGSHRVMAGRRGSRTPETAAAPPGAHLRLSSSALLRAQRGSGVRAALTPSARSTTATSAIGDTGVGDGAAEADSEHAAAAAAGVGVGTRDVSLDSGGAWEESVGRATSLRSYSGASTPRSLTPRSLTPRSGATSLSIAASGIVTQRPFLGFRVHVQRDAVHTSGRSVMTVKEVVPSYVSVHGEVAPGPALLAGMEVGDQLVRFAGYAVTDLAAFNAVVSRHVKPGVDLPVTLLRAGEPVNTTIRVGLKANVP